MMGIVDLFEAGSNSNTSCSQFHAGKLASSYYPSHRGEFHGTRLVANFAVHYEKVTAAAVSRQNFFLLLMYFVAELEEFCALSNNQVTRPDLPGC